MTTLYILVEGQTEEAFVKNLILPHCAPIGLFITPVIFKTSPGHKGGLGNYPQIKKELISLLKIPDAWVSTMFDLYALPKDFPGKADSRYSTFTDGVEKAKWVEQALRHDIDRERLIPYLMVHEFETLLFTQPEKFSAWFAPKAVQALQDIRQKHNPETINEGPNTAPSKRIRAAVSGYQKHIHGPLIAQAIGLDCLRAACPHFGEWLTELRSIVNTPST